MRFRVFGKEWIEIAADSGVIFSGPPGYGKSTYLMDMLPDYLMITNREDLSKFDSSRHKGILYDGFDPTSEMWPIDDLLNLFSPSVSRSVETSIQCTSRTQHKMNAC